MDEYAPFEAAIVSRYVLSRKEMQEFMRTPAYEKIREEYNERIIKVENELFDEIFDEFEDEILEGCGKTIDQVIKAAAERSGVESGSSKTIEEHVK